MISPDFPLELTGFFPVKHIVHFLVLKMKNFQNFVPHNCIRLLNSPSLVGIGSPCRTS